MVIRLPILTLLAAISTSLTGVSYGADRNGNYMVGGGISTVTCIDFIAAMERARQLGWMRPNAVDIVDPYLMFMSGYQTAYNVHVADTCDVFRATDGSDLPNRLLQIENLCRQSPELNFGRAVIRYAETVSHARLRSCPQR